eukprot:2251841-Amphidinium_carterae.1
MSSHSVWPRMHPCTEILPSRSIPCLFRKGKAIYCKLLAIECRLNPGGASPRCGQLPPLLSSSIAEVAARTTRSAQG